MIMAISTDESKMHTIWKQFKTADGSYTVVDRGYSTKEPMHSSAGAQAETSYVYGEAFSHLENFDFAAYDVLVMGSGLGLIEADCLNRSLQQGMKISQLISIEKDLMILNTLVGYLKHVENLPERSLLRKNYAPYTSAVISQASQMLSQQQWSFFREIDEVTQQKFHLICYDLYCQKTHPEKWTEEYFINFLNQYAHESCVLATYAATGALKRALRYCGFEIKKRKGFAHKAECTLAVRK